MLTRMLSVLKLAICIVALLCGPAVQAQSVTVTPMSSNSNCSIGPNGSGIVFQSLDGSIADFTVSISTPTGVSTAFVSVSSGDAMIFQDGASGQILATPLVLKRQGQTAFGVAVTSNTSNQSTASQDWLNSYANWFNSTFGSGWSQNAGGVIHSALTTVIEEETLANTSSGVLLTGTIVVSVPIAIGTVAGGEVLLGVGTFGGTATGGATLTGGTLMNANRLIHIFGQARHNLSGLLSQFGGNQTAAFNAVQNATVTALSNAGVTSGTFQTTVTVGGLQVTVRGIVENGIVRIATFFM
jgi:hypothetical protein